METKEIQNIMEELKTKFNCSKTGCIEMDAGKTMRKVSISVGRDVSVKLEDVRLEDAQFMVTGEDMFPKYVNGIEKLAGTIYNLDQVIEEQRGNTRNGFHYRTFEV